ncbi:MAG: peptidoglycan-binding protein, partial [Candidatus Sungbacteria bacterium]|nr:peptidoglycan-binding protein [Candidatus Sungbacteria bacterium]
LRVGSRGADVRVLQQLLAQDPTLYPERKVTGYYATNTRAAIRRFQERYGLPVTGSVDTATRTKLNEVFP